MPPLLSSSAVGLIFWIATALSLIGFVREKDYTALALLPGLIGVAVFYSLVDAMTVEAARAWARWVFSFLGVQIIIILAWRYFSLKGRIHHG